MGIVKEFTDFLTKQNVAQLAVAVVMGVALNNLVLAFVAAFITPAIGVLSGSQNFNSIGFIIRGNTFQLGYFINQLVSFIIIVLVVFVLIVRTSEHLKKRFGKQEPTMQKTCPYCKTDIPIDATRCPNCTSKLKKG